MAHLWSTWCREAWRDLMAGAWNPLNVDASCGLRPYLEVLGEIPMCELSIWSGVPHNMVAGFPGQVSCMRQTKNNWETKKLFFLWSNLVSHIALFPLCSILDQSLTRGGGKEGNRFHLLRDSSKILEECLKVNIIIWLFLESTTCQNM